jgi:hypothetical protein
LSVGLAAIVIVTMCDSGRVLLLVIGRQKVVRYKSERYQKGLVRLHTLILMAQVFNKVKA